MAPHVEEAYQEHQGASIDRAHHDLDCLDTYSHAIHALQEEEALIAGLVFAE